MRFRKNDPDAALDRAAAEVREEKIDPAAVGDAAQRVWARLSSDSADGATGSVPADGAPGCAGCKALIPAYLEDELSQARLLLFEDHMRECVTCRRALEAARSGGAPIPREVSVFPVLNARRRSLAPRWGIAAAAGLVAVGIWSLWALGGFGFLHGLLPGSPAGLAEIRSVEGALYKVSGGENLPVAGGQRVALGTVMRTAKDSHAVVRLTDGSLIEMKERSEISIAERRQETTIHLTRGSIIVEAAKQRTGHLYVATDDCLVSVVGTIFSVNHGSKGSRVSVIEGEVHVQQGREQRVLLPGEQLSTHSSLGTIPVGDEIAWSRDAGRYDALLHELTALGRDLNRAIVRPGLRHSTRLLDSAPRGTVLYAAIPNLSGSLSQAHELMQQRIEQSEVLRDFWQKSLGPSGADPQIKRVIDKIRVFGEHLGDEVALAVETDEKGEFKGVLLMAELKRPEAFRSVLETEIRNVGARSEGGATIRLLDDPAAEPARASSASRGKEVLLWIHGDLLVAATDASLLREESAILEKPGSAAFVGTPLHARLADSYREGASWLFGVDVQSVLAKTLSAEGKSPAGDQRLDALRGSGVFDAQLLVFESKDDGKMRNDRATLTFDRPRRGLASWLAAPAPMGALEFVSSEATFLAAFVVKNPASLVDDLYGFIEASDPELGRRLDRFESESGLHVREDIAAPLGGEIAVALDGPLLPVPAWKLVVEVYDPVRLQRTIEGLVDRANRSFSDAAEERLLLERTDSAGRAYYTLRSPRSTIEVHYTYADGYLIAAPSRALLDLAIECRDSGQVLTSSPKFRALLPRDGQADFSAVVFEDLGSVLSPLAQQFAGRTESAAPEAPRVPGLVDVLAAGAPAKLAFAYGEEDRIVFTSSSDSTFGPDLGTLFGLGGLAEMRKTIAAAAGRQAPIGASHGGR